MILFLYLFISPIFMYSKIRDRSNGSIEAKVPRYALFKSREIKSWKQHHCLATFTDSFEGKWTFYSTLIQCNDCFSGQERNSERVACSSFRRPRKNNATTFVYIRGYVHISDCRLNGDSLRSRSLYFHVKTKFSHGQFPRLLPRFLFGE